MSEFSGKCDIYDDMFTINKITDFSNVHIYVRDHPIELRINSVKDLVPYSSVKKSKKDKDLNI